ncbi:MAG TPA: alpha/beta hydrolase [Chitinophagaceae bacterium]|nr:alpha/beta hydrolase [Chitinophagaceae bacterium]
MNKLSILLLSIITFASCKKTNVTPDNFTTTKNSLPTHKLVSFSITKNTKYLIVFEAGLGDDHAIWNQKNLPTTISAKDDVLLYDRAGYGKSEKGPAPRNIAKLSGELDSVINKFANGRKVILVGHSLAGMIMRDYAIKNPTKIAGILFIDPSHEAYNNPTQAQEDLVYNAFLNSNGADFGATMEARELVEDSQYMTTLPNLPNVPTIVITSMKVDASHSASDRQNWFNAHEKFKIGVSDFTHISTTNSGHYIFIEEPNLVLDNLNLLISKLP